MGIWNRNKGMEQLRDAVSRVYTDSSITAPDVIAVPGSFGEFQSRKGCRLGADLEAVQEINRKCGDKSYDVIVAHESGHHELRHAGVIFQDVRHEELYADMKAGYHAGAHKIQSTVYERLIAPSEASDTHPAGSMRMKAFAVGQKLGENDPFSGLVPQSENALLQSRIASAMKNIIKKNR